MITKNIGDRFKISFKVLSTAGEPLERSVATIRGINREHSTEATVTDDKVSLLVTEEMYDGEGEYQVVFDNYFVNEEKIVHKKKFKIVDTDAEVKEVIIEKETESEEKTDEHKEEDYMGQNAEFKISMSFLDSEAIAALGEEYRNPLLSPVELIFTDDKPNANSQGIGRDEFDNLLRSMKFMPIKAKFSAESGLEGHAEADIIGIIKEGRVRDDKIVALGALYNDEFPAVVSFFKEETEAGSQIDFSWEIRYKDSEVVDDVEWLKATTTKAITAVHDPAYEGRTSLVSISSIMEKLDIDTLVGLEKALAEEVDNG